MERVVCRANRSGTICANYAATAFDGWARYDEGLARVDLRHFRLAVVVMVAQLGRKLCRGHGRSDHGK